MLVSMLNGKESSHMDMVRVNSSAISAVGYDPTSRRMKITFTQGHTYDFCGVPQHVYDGLLRASSKDSTTMTTLRTGTSVKRRKLRHLLIQIEVGAEPWNGWLEARERRAALVKNRLALITL